MNVYVVYCHPLADSFMASARDRALAGLQAGGHQIRITDLYAEGFEPSLSLDEHVNHLGSIDDKPAIAEYAANLRWCDTLVYIYPTWWSGQPAMLKCWIDRVWVKGVAFDLPPGAARITPMLTNIRRIVAITSHGSSKFVNALEGESGKRVITRSLRVLCSKRCTTTWIALYAIDTKNQVQRSAFLDRVEQRLRTM